MARVLFGMAREEGAANMPVVVVPQGAPGLQQGGRLIWGVAFCTTQPLAAPL